MTRVGALLLALCACGAPDPEAPDPLDAVDPFLGTGGLGFGAGSITPGPKHPFGMANPAPDTAHNGAAAGFSHCAGYYYEDDEVRGFSQVHLSGTGVPDYGVLLFMPVTKPLESQLTERFYRDTFDHRSERASVGEYAVHLLESDVEVEMTATPRTALYRIGYPSGRPAQLVVNLDHGLGNGETKDGRLTFANGELSGHLLHAGGLSRGFGGFSLDFVVRFSTPPSIRMFSSGAEIAGTEVTGPKSAALLEFSEPNVSLQVGLSFVDEAGARQALEAEWADFDFEKTRDAVRAAWSQLLGKVRVEGGSEDDRKVLYSALYHAYQMPTLQLDLDGRYRGADQEVHEADFTYYSDFSLWDTYRTAHPLFSLLTPSIQEDFNRSLVRMLDDSGHLPRWPLADGDTRSMVGNHGESMLIDAYLRGVGGFDAESVYQQLVAAADGPIEANGVSRASRECLDRYLTLGYCPAGNDSVSETLENAYNDWMLHNLASALGHPEDAERFLSRSRSWRNVFNPATGYAHAKDATGAFAPDFDPEVFSDDFIEGNSRQWTVYVPYEVNGLDEAMGGGLVDHLESFFQNAAAAEDTIFPDLFYWHGNEVDLHTAYLFSQLGRPDLTQQWVAWIMDTRYRAGPDGLDGNDDGGTLSAWYVLSAAGIYPLAGSDRWILGAPRFEQMELELDGHTLTIERRGSGSIARVELDGNTVERTIGHSELLAASKLVFVLE